MNSSAQMLPERAEPRRRLFERADEAVARRAIERRLQPLEASNRIPKRVEIGHVAFLLR